MNVVDPSCLIHFITLISPKRTPNKCFLGISIQNLFFFVWKLKNTCIRNINDKYYLGMVIQLHEVDAYLLLQYLFST